MLYWLTPVASEAPEWLSIAAAMALLEAALGVLGGSGSGNQWLGVRSLPLHPVGIVSSRQRATRTVPVPSSAS